MSASCTVATINADCPFHGTRHNKLTWTDLVSTAGLIPQAANTESSNIATGAGDDKSNFMTCWVPIKVHDSLLGISTQA